MTDYSALFQHWYQIFVKYGRRPPKRYREILQYIASHDVRSIMEIGVYTGIRASEMITASAIHHARSDIQYIGFDLFEEMTPDLCVKEFSKMPDSEANIRFSLQQTGASIELWKGFSQETLPRAIAQKLKPIDLIFIDGGHAEATIQSDWANVKKLMGTQTIVYFDDYYTNDPDEVVGIGCQNIIHELDPSVYDVRIGAIEDSFVKEWGTLKIKLVSVSLRAQ